MLAPPGDPEESLVGLPPIDWEEADAADWDEPDSQGPPDPDWDQIEDDLDHREERS